MSPSDPSASPAPRVYARRASAFARWGYAAAWVAVVLGPWLLLSRLLCLPPAPTPRVLPRGLHAAALWLLQDDPFAEAARLATAGAVALLVLALWIWAARERSRERSGAPWIEAGWATWLGAPPALLAVLIGLHWEGVPLTFGLPSALASTRAWEYTSLGLWAALGLAPSAALWAARAALRRGFGACAIGAQDVRLQPGGLLPWTAVVPKAHLGARTITRRGVRVEVPRAGALLIPTAGDAETAEALGLLDDQLPAARPEPPAASGTRALIALAVLAPTATAVLALGRGWALPAFAGALALEAPALALLPRAPRRAKAAALALGACATWLALGPWPLYRVATADDFLGNGLTRIGRLGEPEWVLLLGERPAEVRVPGLRTLRFAGGRPGLRVDLVAGRIEGAGGSTVSLNEGTRVLVHAPDGSWEFGGSPPDALTLGWPEGYLHRGGLPNWVARAAGAKHPELGRYASGITSTTLRGIQDWTGERLLAVIEGGRPRYVVARALHSRGVSFRRSHGRLAVVNAGAFGWRPGDGGRLLWRGPYAPGGDAILAFPGEPPALPELEAVFAAVEGGRRLEDAGRGVLPFWDLAPRPPLGRTTLRELGFALRTRGSPRPYELSTSAQRAIRGVGGLGLAGLGMGTPEGAALRARIAAEAARSPAVRTRLGALDMLYGPPPPLARDLLRAALTDPAPRVRAKAAALAAEPRFAAPWVAPELEALLDDPDAEVRAAARTALGR